MIILNCDNISLSFGTEEILKNITFSLNDGEKLGIVGINGAGKSSLFKIICGKYDPSSGNVCLQKDTTIGLLEQNIEYDTDKTVLEESYDTFSDLIKEEAELEKLRKEAETDGTEKAAARYSLALDRFTEKGGYEFRGRCKGILKNLGFDESFFNLSVSALSGGQKTRLALACILLRNPDILMLDEPTNHLDMESLFWLEGYLRNSKKTILVISHDRYFLDRVSTKILELEYGKGKLYNGNYTAYVNKKEEDRRVQEHQYKNQQKEIARIKAYIEQQRRWNREKNIIAAESREKQLKKMELIDKPDAVPDSVRMSFSTSSESGNDVLTIRNLRKGYPGKPLFEDLNALITKREHVFIFGENGCGKSTLIKIIAGKLRADGGHIDYGSNVVIGYYDQENHDLDMSNTVLEEIWKDYSFMTQTEMRDTLALFLFKGDDVFKKVSTLSGGEKARLTLAKLMLSKMNLLILDEPTNHLDIPSRERLEDALLSFDGTIVAVSHDRYFISKLATRILSFGTEERYHIYDFRGSYPEFVSFTEKRKAESAAGSDSAKETPPSASKEQYLASKRDQAEKRKLTSKIKKAKEDIASFEKRIGEIDLELEGDAAYDHIRLAALTSEKDELEEKLLSLYEFLCENGEDI